MNKRSPWAWVPTLYFAEGVPYVAVMTISVIIYKRLGLSNTDITLYTSGEESEFGLTLEKLRMSPIAINRV